MDLSALVLLLFYVCIGLQCKINQWWQWQREQRRQRAANNNNSNFFYIIVIDGIVVFLYSYCYRYSYLYLFHIPSASITQWLKDCISREVNRQMYASIGMVECVRGLFIFCLFLRFSSFFSPQFWSAPFSVRLYFDRFTIYIFTLVVIWTQNICVTAAVAVLPSSFNPFLLANCQQYIIRKFYQCWFPFHCFFLL